MHSCKNPAWYSFLAFCLSLSVQASAGELQSLKNGQHAFNSGNYALSFALWQTEALQDDSDAQVFLGLSYANGWGVRKNMELARIWYQKAATNNNPSGQLLLGLYYLLQGDNQRAAGLNWLTRAAEGGDKQAREFLAKGHAKGWFHDINSGNPVQTSRHSPLSPIALATIPAQ